MVRDARTSVAGNQEMVEVFAAGNDGEGNPDTGGLPNPNEGYGTIMAEATAKNVITVGRRPRACGASGHQRLPGAEEHRGRRARDITSTSRVAAPPTTPQEARNSVAPGTHMTRSPHRLTVTTAPAFAIRASRRKHLYSLSTGTSHSTPVVAGMAALFRESATASGRAAAPPLPSPALTRAALANASTDLVGGTGAGGSAPSSNQGWGLGNLARLLDTGSRFLDQETRFDATGETLTRSFAATTPAQPVRVTLAWTDPPGPTSGNSFVNNLDLSVTRASSTFKGNVFSGGVSITGGTADTRNNLESVYLPAGVSGDFTVTVTAANIAGNGVPGVGDGTDQDFALVVSNAGVTAPEQPTGLVATPGADSITLDWPDVSSATGYELFRREAGGTYRGSPTATTAASEFVDAGRIPGQQYCYVVRALNDVTPGPLSDEGVRYGPRCRRGSGRWRATARRRRPESARSQIDLSSLRASRVGPRRFCTLRFAATPGRTGSIRLKTVRAFATRARRRRRGRSQVVPPSPRAGR